MAKLKSICRKLKRVSGREVCVVKPSYDSRHYIVFEKVGSCYVRKPFSFVFFRTVGECSDYLLTLFR